MNRTLKLIFLLFVAANISSCGLFEPTIKTPNPATVLPMATVAASLTPFQPEPTSTATETPKTFKGLTLFIDPAVPEKIRDEIPTDMIIANDPAQADISIISDTPDKVNPGWIYVVVGPFPMLLDNLSWGELQNRWKTSSSDRGAILLSESTFNAMKAILGEANPKSVEIISENQLIDRLWQLQNALAIVPFEDLEPRLKVISIDGQSPISNQFDPSQYPLAVTFAWQIKPEVMEVMRTAVDLGETPYINTNRDPDKLTVLAMTGVTALVRATATRMEQMGMTYPGRDIHDWLVNADLTHISNEVSFTPTCPNPDPNQVGLMFCSKPEYLQLLDYVGTDILELSGNHEADWGREPFEYSLELYKQHGWTVYAAGMNVEQARAAAIVEHNGNRLAFIGCNPAGPPSVWAGESLSGVANCDYAWMHAEIQRLKEQGYIAIMTFQYFESYRANVESYEETDFRGMVDAGADIVSGSQAHHPMAMEFYGGSFIHYGLGNLFFDQMFNQTYTIPMGTRKEFIDRHVFYDGKYISTQLLTALLEDFARPRPMTTEERQNFLQEIFDAGSWTPGTPWSYQIK